MHFTVAFLLSVAALAVAAPSPQNAGRPVPNGACCTTNTSLKQDVCNVNGSAGRCVPSSANNCEYLLRATRSAADKVCEGGGALTCIEDARLTCDANTLERGRPRCRLAGE